MSLIRKMIYFFNYQLRLKYKLLLTFIIIILFPMLMLSFIINDNITKIFETQLTRSANQSFDLLIMALDNTIGQYDNILFSVSQDEIFPSVLLQNRQTYSRNEQVSDKAKLEKRIYSYMRGNDYGHIKLYFMSDFNYFTNEQTFYNIDQIKSEKWYQNVYGHFEFNRRPVLLCPPSYISQNNDSNSKVISLARVIINPNNYKQLIGLIRIDFSEEIIRQILSNNNSFDESLTYMINDEDIVISTSSEALITSYHAPSVLNYKPYTESNIFKVTLINNEHYFVRQYYVDKYHYNLITVIPYENVYQQISSLRSMIITLFIVLCIFAFILAALISSTMTKRILKVVHHMNKMKKGYIEPIVSNAGDDEIGELIENYNYMVQELQTFIKLQFENGKEIKNAELNVLQAQINPHFLYNTLDMINWLASRNMNNEIRTVVIALSKFYRLSLSKGLEEISIKDELTHISVYMQIQNMRFKNKLEFIIDVEEDLQDYRILKTTFQPIVENAILHGIMEKEDNRGHIKLSGKVIENDLVFSIIDDGIGMSDEKIELILLDKVNGKYLDHTSGYGVTNVNKRMKLYYGNEYGLKYESELNKGTTVEIKIPLKK